MNRKDTEFSLFLVIVLAILFFTILAVVVSRVSAQEDDLGDSSEPGPTGYYALDLSFDCSQSSWKVRNREDADYEAMVYQYDSGDNLIQDIEVNVPAQGEVYFEGEQADTWIATGPEYWDDWEVAPDCNASFNLPEVVGEIEVQVEFQEGTWEVYEFTQNIVGDEIPILVEETEDGVTILVLEDGQDYGQVALFQDGEYIEQVTLEEGQAELDLE